MEIGTPSDDVGPSEHDRASPKEGESGRLAVELLCMEIGMCGVVKRRNTVVDANTIILP